MTGRSLRIIGLSFGALLLCVILAAAVVLYMARPRSPHWETFAIGPASGPSSSVQPDGIRAEGISLKGAIALAYDLPTVRVIGPEWLAQRRYSLHAVVPKAAINDAAMSWRPLLLQELTSRLRLRTHIEQRPFDVLVLTAGPRSRLPPAPGGGLAAWVGDGRVRMNNATTADLAHVLQGILGVPVVDESGLRGSFDLEFGWREDRVPSVTAALAEQYGLLLTPGRRPLEALIIDEARRDVSLVLLTQAERATRGAPASIRRHIADLLTVR
jgi:uncharacterized protein (TIGR03435 family)